MAITTALYKAVRKYHTFVGIFVAIHLLILACTGLLLLFKDEIQHHHKMELIVNQSQFAEKYDEVYRYLLAAYPNDKLLDIYPDDNNPQIIQARLGKNGSNKVRGARTVNFDYQSGKEIKADELPASAFYDWIMTLHEKLFMGQRGQIYIGFVGIAFVLMNISGLIMFIKRRRIKKYRSNNISTRAKYINVHESLGVICLCWGLIVGVTGTLLALNPVFTKNFQEHTLKSYASKYQAASATDKSDISLNRVINTAFATKHNGVIWYIVFPGMERGIPGHYLVLMHGNGLISQYINEYLLIDAKNAELKAIIPLPVLMQLALIATPFHFVNYGGIVMKIIWSIFAICTLGFAFMGIIISWQRRTLAYDAATQSIG